MRIYSLKSWPFRFIFNNPSHLIIIEIVMDISNSVSSLPNVDGKQNVTCPLYKIKYCTRTVTKFVGLERIYGEGEGKGDVRRAGVAISLGWYLIL